MSRYIAAIDAPSKLSTPPAQRAVCGPSGQDADGLQDVHEIGLSVWAPERRWTVVKYTLWC